MRTWLLSLALAIWMPVCAIAADVQGGREAAGKVELTIGSVTSESADRLRRPLNAGDAVYEGDVIVTGSDGEAHLRMADQAFIAVRGKTRFKIDSYRANGDERDSSAFTLIVGALRAVTGWIGRHNRERYAIKTPTVVIGIRGTDHETLVLEEDDEQGEAGTYETVHDGRVALGNEDGEVEIGPGEAAFAPLRGDRMPRVLPYVPKFFPKGKHDQKLEGMHATVQREMLEARADRIKALLQRADTPAKREAVKNAIRQRLKKP